MAFEDLSLEELSERLHKFPFVYEEVPSWRVPVLKRVAADVMREVVQDDLGVSFEVKWLRELSGDELEQHRFLSRMLRLAGEPVASISKHRRIEMDQSISGVARGLESGQVWVLADREPREVALIVAHEARHRKQFHEGSLPVLDFRCDAACDRAAERDAVAYEAKAGAWVPRNGPEFASMLEYKTANVKSVDSDGFFTGHASTFGNVDLQGDVVMPGAFAATLTEDGRKRALLFQHEVNREIGLVSCQEDDAGLWVSGLLYVSPDGDPAKELVASREALVRMKRRRAAGMPQQMSIGFRTRKSTRRSNGVRELHDIQLYEVSLVTFAANPQAQVSA